MMLRTIGPIIVALSVVAGTVGAQGHAPVRPEIRIDATSADVQRLDLGVGAAIPMGTYVRLALLAGAGVARSDARDDAGEGRAAAARADVIARFQMDPFHASMRGLYGGGGVSYLASEGERGRVYLSLVAGLELRDRGPVTPALEVALGGGLRVGIALRRTAKGWR
jgi:hypothetical protein